MNVKNMWFCLYHFEMSITRISLHLFIKKTVYEKSKSHYPIVMCRNYCKRTRIQTI
jgi:hypothetical protein